MLTLEALRRNLDSAHDLQSVVRTMKTLAAVSIQQYQQAVHAVDEYHRTVELGLQIALRQQPGQVLSPQSTADEPVGIIVIGSDQGMCGTFNEEIAEHVVRTTERLGLERPRLVVLAVGLRVVGPLVDRDFPVDTSLSLPSSPETIKAMVQELVLRLDRYHDRQNVNRFLLFHNRPLSGSTHRPGQIQVLPVDPEWLQLLERDPWPGPTIPKYTMDWDRLFTALIHQYLLITFYRAMVQSLASENASRLAAMQAAERNIDELLQDLTARYHSQRQTAITEELLEIVAGFEALGGEAGEPAF